MRPSIPAVYMADSRTNDTLEPRMTLPMDLILEPFGLLHNVSQTRHEFIIRPQIYQQLASKYVLSV
jgi:hypothetical protein